MQSLVLKTLAFADQWNQWVHQFPYIGANSRNTPNDVQFNPQLAKEKVIAITSILSEFFFNLMSDWSLVSDLFCFSWSCSLKEIGFKRKNKKYPILKQILACSGCFGLFNKNKKGFRTGFWCIISASYFHKNVPY